MGIEFNHFGDGAFKLVGKLTGKTYYDAIGRYGDLLRLCLERGAPEVSKALVDAHVSLDGFAQALVDAELVDDLGPKIKIREKVEWLAAARARQKVATAAAAARWDRHPELPGIGESSDSASNGASYLGPNGASNPASNNASKEHPLLTSYSFLPSSEFLNPDLKKKSAERKSRSRLGGVTGDPAPSKTGAVFTAYCDAYVRRYGEEARPRSGAKIRGQMGTFIDLVGAEDAPAIVEFFLSHNKMQYVDRGHDFGLCLLDATALRTQWLTGRKITRQVAKSAERKEGNLEAFGVKSAMPRGQEIEE